MKLDKTQELILRDTCWDVAVEWADKFEYRKTKYISPHEYLVENNDNTMLFSTIRILIQIDPNAYYENFYRTRFYYINIGDYKYWVMNGTKSDILNRALISIGNPK